MSGATWLHWLGFVLGLYLVLTYPKVDTDLAKVVSALVVFVGVVIISMVAHDAGMRAR